MVNSDGGSEPVTLLSVLLFAVVALLFHWFGKKQDAFRLPHEKWQGPHWTLLQILVIFALYIATVAALPRLLHTLIKSYGGKMSQPAQIALAQWVSVAGPAIIFSIVCTIWMRRETWAMWKSRRGQTFWGDVGYGVLYWALSLPVVFAINHLFEFITSALFEVHSVEQVAVTYLRMSMSSPFYFMTALIAIVLAAPFIEEFLFRCCLQGYLRKMVGSKSAILITALIFSLFHYASPQGYSNIPILTSLFALAIYLGWVYEKRQSLWASISLHMTFNAANVGYILTTMESLA